MNVLSSGAVWGALVWIFQDGNLARCLDFTPTGSLDLGMPILLIIIIIIIILITAAAALFAVVLAAVPTSGVTPLKLFGVGAALAVLVDATVVRGVLVPAFMRVADRADWWAPGPIRRLHHRFGFREEAIESAAAGGTAGAPGGRHRRTPVDPSSTRPSPGPQHADIPIGSGYEPGPDALTSGGPVEAGSRSGSAAYL